MKFSLILALAATTQAVSLSKSNNKNAPYVTPTANVGPDKIDDSKDDETVVLQLHDGVKVVKGADPTPTANVGPDKIDDSKDDDKVVYKKQKMAQRPRQIYDADGDGVEDNVHKTRDELDRFYIPFVFGPAEEMHNTHHGNLPGHVRKEEYEGEPTSFVERLRF